MEEILGSELITTEDFVRLANEKGLDLNLRKLRFYISEGIIPKPEVIPVKGIGRKGFYPKSTLNTLFLVFLLHDQGYTLNNIKLFLDRLEKIAQFQNKNVTELHKELLGLFGSNKETVLSNSFWEEAGKSVFEEMLKNNYLPDFENIERITVSVDLKDGNKFSTVLYNLREKIKVRRLQSTDYTAFKQFISIVEKRDGTVLTFLTDPETQFNEFKNYRYAACPENYIVAVKNDQIIGFVGIRGEELRLKKGMALLDGPLVHPDFRSQGIATELLHNLFADIKKRGIRVIDVLLPTTCISYLQFLRKKFDFNIAGYLWMMRLTFSEKLKIKSSNGKNNIKFVNYRQGIDLKAFTDVYNEASSDWWFYIPLNIDEAKEEEKEGSIIDFSSIVLVFDRDKAVGFSYFPVKEPVLYFRVIKEYRGRNIEAQLVDRALEYARAHNFPFVDIIVNDNESGIIKMIEKKGFDLQDMIISLHKEL